MKALFRATYKHSIPGIARSQGYSCWMFLDHAFVSSLRSLRHNRYMVATKAMGRSMMLVFGSIAINEISIGWFSSYRKAKGNTGEVWDILVWVFITARDTFDLGNVFL